MTIPAEGWVDLDGQLLPAAEATVSIFNHGFLFGDSVYDVVRTYGGQPSLLDEHLDRLESSAEAIGLALPVGRDELARRIARASERAGFAESYVRIVVARGDGPPNIDPGLAGPARTIVIVLPLQAVPAELVAAGVPVIVSDVVRTPLAHIKSGNYLTSVQAIRQARELGAFEALMCNAAGELCEGSTSSVFWVAGGVLRTPALECGILPSITRRHVLRLAAAEGLPVEEGRWPAIALRTADEAMLASTIKEVLPIRAVDGAALPVSPGPVTSRLRAAYLRHVLADAGVAGDDDA